MRPDYAALMAKLDAGATVEQLSDDELLLIVRGPGADVESMSDSELARIANS
jgi:hypothetical protein